MTDIKLDCLFLHAPDGNGRYHQISVQQILDDQDPCETAALREWIANHVMQHLDWPEQDIPLTEEHIHKAFKLFEKLDIKPKNIFYLGKDTENHEDYE